MVRFTEDAATGIGSIRREAMHVVPEDLPSKATLVTLEGVSVQTVASKEEPFRGQSSALAIDGNPNQMFILRQGFHFYTA